MRVALIHDARFPVSGYGGTERVVWWLAKGLAEKGIDILFVCREGSSSPFGKTIPPRDFSERMVDLLHFFNTPLTFPSKPYIVTIGGNGKRGESFLPNTVFVSQNHAQRHGATAFVHNGLDPDEYQYRESKGNALAFLAKASWNVKNVQGAIRLARKSKHPLKVMGGTRLFLKKWRGVEWKGTVTGNEKAQALAESSGLLFPVLWNEPFGIAVIEALVSGTPVLATPLGSLPELVSPQVGKLCHSDEEFLHAIDHLSTFKPRDCRNWVLEHFTYRHMANRYLEMYEKILAGERLNAKPPYVAEEQGKLFSYPLKNIELGNG